MNGQHPSLENLHLHYDGELSGPELGALQTHLPTCGACQAELESLARLSGMVRLSTHDAAAASEVNFDKMFERISVEIAQPTASVQDKDDAVLTRPAEVARAIPVESKVITMPPQRSRFWRRAAPTLGALAVAAAALLVLVPSEDDSLVASIGEFETGEGYDGQKFEIPDDNGHPTNVLWMTDDPDTDEEVEN